MEKSNSVLFPFLCDDCGWSFETSDKLQQHTLNHHGVEYSCSLSDDNNKGELESDGDHQRLRLHIKRNFVTAVNKSPEIDPEASPGITVQKDVQEHCERAVCKKCNISFFSKVLFERHLKGHVHESELAVKVHRIKIPVEVLRDVSNSFTNRASRIEAPTPEATVLQGDAVSGSSRPNSAPSASSVDKCPGIPAPAVTMETPISSELLSRTLFDELSGFMKDVTESILTSPQKGTDNHFDHMTVVEPTSKNAPLPVGINHTSPKPSPEVFQPSPVRDYSQPPTFPRLCSSPTENIGPLPPPQVPRSNPPNPRLAAILQLPAVRNRPSPPPLASAALSSANTSVTTASNSYAVHRSADTQSSVARTSPLVNSQAVSAVAQNSVSQHTIAAGAASSHTLTTMAPSQTTMLSGGQTFRQYGQSLNTGGSCVTVTNHGQVMQRAVPTSSPGTQRAPPSLITSAAGRQTSTENPLAMLNLSVSRIHPTKPVETNVSVQERPASVIVLEHSPENSVPSIHSVVSLQPGYRHESWGNIVVPAAAEGTAQHIHQNPSSNCRCLICRDILGGDLLRKSQQVENGRCEYKCPKCRRLFTQKTSFIRHCKTFQHAFICDMCHCGFLTEAPYETHKSLHLMKGLLHSAPPQPSLSAGIRPLCLPQGMPQGPGSRPATNHQMAAGVPLRQSQGLPVMGHGQPSVLVQQQRKQSMQQRINPGAPSGPQKPPVDDGDDDVVVLEPDPARYKQVQKPQYKRAAERSMTMAGTGVQAPQLQQPTVVPKAMPGRRVSFVQQIPTGMPQQQQKPQVTMQPLTSATPPQISRILNNSELTLTPIARTQDAAPVTSVADMVLRSNPNMQMTDNGPQKPVQINVSSSMVGLAQPITATPRKHVSNILAKRPQAVSVTTTSAPQSNVPASPSSTTFTAPQSQPSNVYRVLPSGPTRPGTNPTDAGNLQMNSMNRGAMPMWHHPVRPTGSSPVMGRQGNQVGRPPFSGTLRPQSLPSSHQSHGPNRYPPGVSQPQAGGPIRYVGSMRLPPPPPYTQASQITTHGQFPQNRPQVRPPVHQMQAMAPNQQKDRMVKCKICGGVYPTVPALQAHFEHTHAKAFQPQQQQQQLQQQQQQQTLSMQNAQTGSNNMLYQQLQQKMHSSQHPNQLQQSQHPTLQQALQPNQLQQMQQLSQQLQKPPSYDCRRCQKSFQNVLQFKSHEVLCNEKVECMKCHELVFKNELLSHYSKVHHNGNPLMDFENGSQTDGSLSNRISPNNPIFALPPQAAMAISPGHQSGNSGSPSAVTPLGITGFSLNEASESLVKQMSLASEPLLPPPPLVKLSTVGLTESGTNDAVQQETTIPEVDVNQDIQIPVASVPSDGHYFTNAEVAEDDMPYPIIHSVQSLSEGNITDLQPEVEYEKPLTPVLALVGELVSTVEEECNKDSLLDEASGLFVKLVSQDPAVCESETGDTVYVPRTSVTPSIIEESSVLAESSELEESSVSPETPMDSSSPRHENNVEPIEQSEDSAWLHESFLEDSCDKSPTPLETAAPETADVALSANPQSESDDFESQTDEMTTTLTTSSNAEELDAADKGSTSEDVLDVVSIDEPNDQVEKDTESSTTEVDIRSVVVEVPDVSEGEERAVESATDTTDEPAAGKSDTDLESKCESDKSNVQNDSDTDTVAMEDDGETSEVTASEEKPASCPICDLEFESMPALVEHSHIHLNTSTHRCTFCSSTFSTNKLLRSHLRTHLRSCRDPPRSQARKRRRMNDLFASGAPENLAIALFDFDKVAENTEYLRRLGIYGFMRFSDMKDFFCGRRRRPREPPLINLPDDEDDEN